MEYEDEWEEQKEEEYDGYFDALSHAFNDVCSCFEWNGPPWHLVNEMVERVFVIEINLLCTIAQWCQCMGC